MCIRDSFWTVYSLGLRLEEALNLQVGDIDAERLMVHIHRGKGAKDRYLPLPSATLLLSQHLRNSESGFQNLTSNLSWPGVGRDHRCRWMHFSADIEQNLMGSGEAERSKSLRPTGSGSASLLEQST